MKSILTILTCSLFLFFWQGTPKKQAPLTKKQLMDTELQKRLSTYRKSKRKKCRADAYARANEIVDSTLIARAKSEQLHKNQRPPKPIKPAKPEILQVQDSSALKPLIE